MVVNDSGKKSFKTTTVGFQSFCGVKENRMSCSKTFAGPQVQLGKFPRGKKILKMTFQAPIVFLALLCDQTSFG